VVRGGYWEKIWDHGGCGAVAGCQVPPESWAVGGEAVRGQGWPKAKPVHSPENRVGQAWRAGSIQVLGEDCFGNVKMFDIPAGHFQCRYCLHIQKIVRVDERGFAACESCGTIHNDGNPDGQEMSKRQKKISKNAFRTGCQRKS
jgi:hypothetical protein